jgi:hypothetical protein
VHQRKTDDKMNSSIYDTRNCDCDLCEALRKRDLWREARQWALFLFVIGILAAVLIWGVP